MWRVVSATWHVPCAMCVDLGRLQGSQRQRDPSFNPHRAMLTVLRLLLHITAIAALGGISCCSSHSSRYSSVSDHFSTPLCLGTKTMLPLFSVHSYSCMLFGISPRFGPTKGKQWALFKEMNRNKLTHKSFAGAILKDSLRFKKFCILGKLLSLCIRRFTNAFQIA